MAKNSKIKRAQAIDEDDQYVQVSAYLLEGELHIQIELPSPVIHMTVEEAEGFAQTILEGIAQGKKFEREAAEAKA